MKIDSDVPAPKPRLKYPWSEMNVGDSVFFEVDYFDGMSKQQVAAHNYGRRHKKKFLSKKVDGGVRIWRIK